MRWFDPEDRSEAVITAQRHVKSSHGTSAPPVLPEVCVLGLTACGAGAVLGVPLAFGLWQLFRAFVVDSGEMPLRFDFGALAWPLAFAAYTVLMLLWMGRRSVRRASIMEVVRQSHTAEPVRAVPLFYGWLGILLTAAGCNYFMGIPHGDDVMLNYQTTGFRETAALRELFGLTAIAPFQRWLERMGFVEDGKLTARAGDGSALL